MRVAVQRKIDQIVGSFLCGVLSLLYFPFRHRSPTKNPPKKILVILLSEMGSLVLSAPMLARLASIYPTASVFLLTFERNREIVELMQLVPSDRICTINDASFLRFCGSCIRSLVRFRRVGVDTAIDCELFSRISSLLSFFCGAGTRVGFHRHTQEGLFRGNFITRKVLYNPYHHISRQFLTLIAAIDSQSVPKAKSIIDQSAIALPRIEFSHSAIEAMRTHLKQTYPYTAEKKLVLIYPSGGLIPIRAWPLGSYVAVARQLLQAGYAVGIIGLEADRQLAEAIVAQLKSADCLNLAGFTKTLKDLLVLFNLASLLITNDGGPGHFTALASIPAIILFGPETPVLYGSLSPQAINMHRQVNCSPCLTAFNHRNSPCDGDNVCLKSIAPQEVTQQALELLDSKGT